MSSIFVYFAKEYQDKLGELSSNLTSEVCECIGRNELNLLVSAAVSYLFY
jgi:hypothetical protein